MLHLLREESLERAIASYPEVEQIPRRNIELMRKLGATKLLKIRQACLLESAANSRIYAIPEDCGNS